MPKNYSIEIMRRWRAMDLALGCRDGLRISTFAKRWNVSTKTVRRDLDWFAELGQRIVRHPFEDRPRVLIYGPEVEWLFTSNLNHFNPERDRITRDRLRQP
jgi:DeoR-like helix-turn-helix domain